jgi:hypothetical protein
MDIDVVDRTWNGGVVEIEKHELAPEDSESNPTVTLQACAGGWQLHPPLRLMSDGGGACTGGHPAPAHA